MLSEAVLPLCWFSLRRPIASMVWLKAASKRTHPSMCLPGVLLPAPMLLYQATADPCLCMRPSNTQARLSLLWVFFCESFVGSLLIFPVSWCIQDFVGVLQDSLFPTFIWKSCYQIPLSFKIRFLGYYQCFCQFPGWEVKNSIEFYQKWY